MNSAVCFTNKTMSHIYRNNLEQEHASEIAETVFFFQEILGSSSNKMEESLLAYIISQFEQFIDAWLRPHFT